MIERYLEIKTCQSVKQVRGRLWKVHEAHLRDEDTGNEQVLRTNTADRAYRSIGKLLNVEFMHDKREVRQQKH